MHPIMQGYTIEEKQAIYNRLYQSKVQISFKQAGTYSNPYIQQPQLIVKADCYNIVVMKIVKRVSLLQGINRIDQPSPAGTKTDRIFWNRTKPYRLNTQQELYRFGYRNYKHKPWLIVAACFACLTGALLQNVEKALMDVARAQIRMKEKERQHSGIWLWVRSKLGWLVNEVIVGNLYPLHEVVVLTGSMVEWEEKFVRIQQYREFMRKRSSKYDFLQLGVLEKFPYPNQTSDKQMPEGM